MPTNDVQQERELRRKKLRKEFSNHENSVTLIGSLEAWFDYRWGKRGSVNAGLLEYFNRFPCDLPHTPDFEVKFKTPYTLWGECKRQLSAQYPGDVQQVLDYAMRRMKHREGGYDVVVLVRLENLPIATKAIDEARTSLLTSHRKQEEKRYSEELAAFQSPPEDASKVLPAAPLPVADLMLAPIVVMGYYPDREQINGESYVVQWRPDCNERFSPQNVSETTSPDDLNGLFCENSYHAIPVNKLALERSGRNPFINDDPPPLYTALRLVVPALNELLSTEESEELQSTGRVEKIVSRDDILSTRFCQAIQPRPGSLPTWIDAAFNALAADIGAAHPIPNTAPAQYKILIDNVLIKADIKDIWSDRAALKAARQSTATRKRGSRRKRTNDDHPRLGDW